MKRAAAIHGAAVLLSASQLAPNAIAKANPLPLVVGSAESQRIFSFTDTRISPS